MGGVDVHNVTILLKTFTIQTNEWGDSDSKADRSIDLIWELVHPRIYIRLAHFHPHILHMRFKHSKNCKTLIKVKDNCSMCLYLKPTSILSFSILTWMRPHWEPVDLVNIVFSQKPRQQIAPLILSSFNHKQIVQDPVSNMPFEKCFWRRA